MDAISALMDGELGADEARRHIVSLKDDSALRARWDDFHLIGDALRGESLLSPKFDEAFSKRLASEPTILAPHRLRSSLKRVTTYAMSAAASLGAVALVAWVAMTPTTPVTVAGAVTAPNPIQPARNACQRIERRPHERIPPGASRLLAEHRDPGPRTLHTQRVHDTADRRTLSSRMRVLLPGVAAGLMLVARRVRRRSRSVTTTRWARPLPGSRKWPRPRAS